MKIAEVVRRKGADVVTIGTGASVADLVQLLADRRIGCVVVSDRPGRVDGIISERDVVRALVESDPRSRSVGDLMTRQVHTCGLDDDLEQVASLMTDHRIRHLPVVVDGQLQALVSIGDVVKSRLEDLQAERDALVGYVHG